MVQHSAGQPFCLPSHKVIMNAWMCLTSKNKTFWEDIVAFLEDAAFFWVNCNQYSKTRVWYICIYWSRDRWTMIPTANERNLFKNEFRESVSNLIWGFQVSFLELERFADSVSQYFGYIWGFPTCDSKRFGHEHWVRYSFVFYEIYLSPQYCAMYRSMNRKCFSVSQMTQTNSD